MVRVLFLACRGKCLAICSHLLLKEHYSHLYGFLPNWWPNYLPQAHLQAVRLGIRASTYEFCEYTNIVYSRKEQLCGLKPDPWSSFKNSSNVLRKIFRKWDYFLKWEYFERTKVPKSCNCIVVDLTWNSSHYLFSPAMSPYYLDLIALAILPNTIMVSQLYHLFCSHL